MNKLIKTVVVLSTLTACGVVHAWGSDRLIRRVTDEVTDLLSDTSPRNAGAIANIAINTQDIKASVKMISGDDIRLSGTPAEVSVTVNQELESKQINIQKSGSQTTKINSNNASNATLTTSNTANTMSTISDNISAIALANSIDATAIGAMNSVPVNAVAGTGHHSSIQTPAVANLAINTNDITARVYMNAVDDISIRNTSINATALGAVNTGSITISAPTVSGHGH